MKVTEFYQFLPHRDDMIWIDEVLDVGETSASCLVIVDHNKMYSSNNKIRQSSMIEWCAQGFGYAYAYKMKDSNTKLTTAYLVGFDKVSFNNFEHINSEKELLINTEVDRTVGPVSYVSAKVTNRNNTTTYCELTLKLFNG